MEVPLDIQGALVEGELLHPWPVEPLIRFPQAEPAALVQLDAMLLRAERPVLLLGAGVCREAAGTLLLQLEKLGIPLMLTWNAMDRVADDHPLYFGRPDTWGQRYANVLLQQADLLLAIGTRLGLQQTGFRWQEFLPVGDIVQVDCDPLELGKGHPEIALGICADANTVLQHLCALQIPQRLQWIDFCHEVRQRLPVVEPVNHTGEGHLSPYEFVEQLSQLARGDDIVIPCSSGSAFTVMMQTFAVKTGQRVVTNKGLASMGYGLSGAIGAAIAGNGTTYAAG